MPDLIFWSIHRTSLVKAWLLNEKSKYFKQFARNCDYSLLILNIDNRKAPKPKMYFKIYTKSLVVSLAGDIFVA